MRFAVTCLCFATLVLTLASCGNTKTTKPTDNQVSAAEAVRNALAEKQAREEQARAERRAAEEAGKLTSINTICPVTGYPVDPTIAPIPIELLIVQPPETLLVGVSSEEAAEAVRHDPDRYAAAARRNTQARGYSKVGR